MKDVRRDLLELTPEALTALANPGFVKRAFKDMAEGRGPVVAVKDDGTIEAVYADGHTAALAAGRSLRDAVCTCPAGGLCRHRVTLIPAYQSWAADRDQTSPEAREVGDAEAEDLRSPAAFTDEQLEQSFKKTVLTQAAALAKTRPAVRLVSGSAEAAVPTAYLPMSTVRFFSARNLAHARCDCLEGGSCAHVVLAIWAFRQARQSGPDFTELTVVLGRDDRASDGKIFEARAERCAAAVYDLLGQIWADGLSQISPALEGKAAEAEILADGLKWRWISEAVSDLRRMLEAYQARSSRFSAAEFINQAAFLQARLEGARYADEFAQSPIPAPQILGVGVAGETALEHLTLIGLGAELWEDAGQQGASCYFVDPDTMTLMVLERGFARDAVTETGGHILSRRVAGLSLKKIAQSQIVTRGAKRKANGLVTIAPEARLTNALPLSGQSWRNLGRPLKYAEAADLLEDMKNRAPEFVLPRQALGRLAILPVGEILEWGWDAGTQKMHALINSSLDNQDGPADQSNIFRLELPYRKMDELSANNLARHLEQRDIVDICGPVTVEAGSVTMVPLALTTAREMVVLAAHSAEERPLPPSDSAAEAGSEINTALDGLQNLLTQYLLEGIRHRSPKMQNDLADLMKTLSQLGLTVCTNGLGQLEAALNQNNRAGQTKSLGRLGLLLNELKKEFF